MRNLDLISQGLALVAAALSRGIPSLAEPGASRLCFGKTLRSSVMVVESVENLFMQREGEITLGEKLPRPRAAANDRPRRLEYSLKERDGKKKCRIATAAVVLTWNAS